MLFLVYLYSFLAYCVLDKQKKIIVIDWHCHVHDWQVSIHLGNWSHVLNYVNKAENTSELAEVRTQVICRKNNLMLVITREESSIWKEIMAMLSEVNYQSVLQCKRIWRKFPSTLLAKEFGRSISRLFLPHFGQEFRTLCISIVNVNLRIKKHELD